MPAVLDLPMPVRSSFSQNPVIGDFVHSFDAGIIEYGGNLTKAQVIAEVCLAFPGIPVLVLSSHRHELRRVFEQLPRYAPFVGVDDVSRGELPIDVVDVETAEDSNDIKSFQLALSTPTNAAMLWDTTGTDVRHYPIVICLDAARAKDLMTSGFLMASHSQFRIFGLKHTGSPFQGEAADLAYNVFGPVSLNPTSPTGKKIGRGKSFSPAFSTRTFRKSLAIGVRRDVVRRSCLAAGQRADSMLGHVYSPILQAGKWSAHGLLGAR